jgi:hypothetical protein
VNTEPESKVSQALRLVDDEGLSIYAAAKQMGMAATSVYSAFQRRKLKILEAREAGVCEKCGAPLGANGKFNPAAVTKARSKVKPAPSA